MIYHEILHLANSLILRIIILFMNTQTPCLELIKYSGEQKQKHYMKILLNGNPPIFNGGNK